MSTATTVQDDSSNGTANQPSRQTNKTTNVYIRLMFLRIGEIDTLNEKYQAQAAVEARWIVNVDKLSSELSLEDQKRLVDGKSISLQKYSDSHWHPQLYIENALGDLKEQIRYTAKKFKNDNQIYVCEHRDIKGLFWEKLELHHFPSDVQDLSISIGSMFYDDKVVLIADPYHPSGINLETFTDQQEWSLYKHVDAVPVMTKEFLFQADDEDDDDDDEQVESANNKEDRKRIIITVTCHAARQSSYFYWNGYCLILLITLISFCIFAIPANLVANRMQTSCTLLLTSITFRWTVNRSLPTISYLTTMDKYAIFCIFALVFQCFWHAFIGSMIFLNAPGNTAAPFSRYLKLDHSVFLAIVTVFIVVHIGLLIWLFCVPLKHRKDMAKKGIKDELALSNKKEGQNRRNSGKNRKKSSFSRIPIADTII